MTYKIYIYLGNTLMRIEREIRKALLVDFQFTIYLFKCHIFGYRQLKWERHAKGHSIHHTFIYRLDATVVGVKGRIDGEMQKMGQIDSKLVGNFNYVFEVVKRIDGCMYAVKHSIKQLRPDNKRILVALVSKMLQCYAVMMVQRRISAFQWVFKGPRWQK